MQHIYGGIPDFHHKTRLMNAYSATKTMKMMQKQMMIRWHRRQVLVTCRLCHTVLQKRLHSKTPLQCLEQEYGASEFLPALKTFIQEKFTSHTMVPNEYDHFNVYNTVHIILPSRPHISDRKCQKTIHAISERSNGPRKQMSSARFDTALVIENADLHREKGGLHGMLIYKLSLLNLTNNRDYTLRCTR